MAKKTVRNSYSEEVRVSDDGVLIVLSITASAGDAHIYLTEEQARELGQTLEAFALVVSAQESSWQ